MKTIFSYFLTVALALAVAAASPINSSAEDFYQGKTIRLIVGYAGLKTLNDILVSKREIR